MTEPDAVTVRLNAIDKKLDQMDAKLDKYATAAGTMDVHDQRLDGLDRQVSALWGKVDGIAGTDGSIAAVKQHQASCPRSQIKWVWVTLIPMALTQLATAAAVIKFCFGG